jgi:hypothetical protein
MAIVRGRSHSNNQRCVVARCILKQMGREAFGRGGVSPQANCRLEVIDLSCAVPSPSDASTPDNGSARKCCKVRIIQTTPQKCVKPKRHPNDRSGYQVKKRLVIMTVVGVTLEETGRGRPPLSETQAPKVSSGNRRRAFLVGALLIGGVR